MTSDTAADLLTPLWTMGIRSPAPNADAAGIAEIFSLAISTDLSERAQRLIARLPPDAGDGRADRHAAIVTGDGAATHQLRLAIVQTRLLHDRLAREELVGRVLLRLRKLRRHRLALADVV